MESRKYPGTITCALTSQPTYFRCEAPRCIHSKLFPHLSSTGYFLSEPGLLLLLLFFACFPIRLCQILTDSQTLVKPLFRVYAFQFRISISPGTRTFALVSRIIRPFSAVAPPGSPPIPIGFPSAVFQSSETHPIVTFPPVFSV